MARTEIRHVGRPGVRLVVIALQLHLHDDAQHLPCIAHQEQYEIGSILGGFNSA